MAYDQTVVDEAIRLSKVEKLSGREIARRLHVGATTVANWLASAAAGVTPDPSPAPVEEEVTDLLLRKARTLLYDIDSWDTSKERLEVAGAVDKLLAKYLSLTGQAEETHVTVESNPELAAWAQAIIKTPSGGPQAKRGTA